MLYCLVIGTGTSQDHSTDFSGWTPNADLAYHVSHYNNTATICTHENSGRMLKTTPCGHRCLAIYYNSIFLMDMHMT